MIGLCGTNFPVFSSNYQRLEKDILELCKIAIFRKSLFWLMMRKLCEFWHYIGLLYNKLLEIISGTRRAFKIWAIMSGSGDIPANVLDIFFAPDLTCLTNSYHSEEWGCVVILKAHNTDWNMISPITFSFLKKAPCLNYVHSCMLGNKNCKQLDRKNRRTEKGRIAFRLCQ